MTKIREPLADIYNLNSPVQYLTELQKLKYNQPNYIVSAFQYYLKNSVFLESKGNITVIDFACGYGVFGALIRKFDQIEHMFKYYIDGYDISDLGNCDPIKGRIEIIGVDVADKALHFALENGFIDYAICHDFTSKDNDIKILNVDKIHEADIIIETGSPPQIFLDCLPGILSRFDRMKLPDILLGPRSDFDLEKIWIYLCGLGYSIQEYDSINYPFRAFESDFERDAVREHVRKNSFDERNVFDENGYLFKIYLCQFKA
ncbi:MAG: hypothetical protein ACFB6R_06340 [Alphaproteobacteria bacterium]